MVKGIDIFRKFFEEHQGQYTIIGSAACDLIFSDAGATFRATKDIDMVLCIEVVDAAFGARFRDFLEAGGYQAAETQDGKRQFYRFHKPADETFPFMIELFSRKPEVLSLPDDVVIAKIPVEEAVISLSAILLDEAYFEALTANRRIIDGVSILDQSLLIPFKARAYLDLADRAAKGERIDSKQIKKHRNDVMRLAQLLPGDAAIALSEPLRRDMRRFLDAASTDTGLDPKTFGVPMSRDEALSFLKTAYKID